MKSKTQSIVCNGEAETFALGVQYGEAAKRGEVYALTGDLGAGKTVFAKGFAKGLGVTEPVTSPTFTILKIYEEGRLPLYHFDVYRIGDVSEMDEIGYEEFFEGDGVCIVEWADLIEELLPEDVVRLKLERIATEADDVRRATIARVENDMI